MGNLLFKGYYNTSALGLSRKQMQYGLAAQDKIRYYSGELVKNISLDMLQNRDRGCITMTKAQIAKTPDVSGGQFRFFTETLEGMISLCPENVFIWVDDKAYSTSESSESDCDGPRNIGLFCSVQEMLEQFKVDGALFSESVLLDIKNLEQICS